VVKTDADGTLSQLTTGISDSDVRFRAHTNAWNGIISLYDSGSNEDVRITSKNGEHSWFNNNGNVGIGTPSPDSLLNLEGAKNTSIITLGSTNNDGGWSVGDKIGAIDFYSADGSGAGAGVKASISYEVEAGTTGSTNSMVFRSAGTSAGTNNTERMRIDSTGNVGIGTPSPDRELEVEGDGNVYIRVTAKTDNDATAIELKNTQETWTIKNQDTNDDALQFESDTVTAMTILKAGNVGIGTPSPSAKLDVNGSATINNVLEVSDVDTGNPTASFNTVRLSGYGLMGNRGSVYITNSDYNGLLQLGVGGSHAQNPKLVISNNNAYFTESLGIGTTSPDADLDVHSSINISNPTSTINEVAELNLRTTSTNWGYRQTKISSTLLNTTTGSNRLDFTIADGSITGGDIVAMSILSEGGNVGIGTNSPSEKLEISSEVANGGGQLSIVNTSQDATTPTTKRAEIIYRTTDTVGTIKDSAYVRVTPHNNNNTSGSSYAIWTRKGNVNPTASMTIDNEGDVGIGTSVPDQNLVVASVNNGMNNGAGTNQIKAQYNSSVNGAGASIAFGVSSGEQYTGAKIVHERTGGNSTGDLSFWTRATAGSTEEDLTTEKMRITSGGDVLIGTQGIPNGTSIYGSAFTAESNDRSLLRLATSVAVSNALANFYNSNGKVGGIDVSGSATTFNTSSDYRLKEDLKDFNGLEMISNIPVYDFKWKTDESRSYGVMAHELQEVLPDAVVGEKDAEEMQGVDYSKIVPLLIKSIQELKAEIDILKAK
jgi:hypothetical protein